MKILGIETSCDETSVALVEGKQSSTKILSNIISSQIDLHKKYGGVVPEVASRAHIEKIIPVFQAALEPLATKEQKNKKTKKQFFSSSVLEFLSNVDALAVTTGPGLIGSLLIGINFAKTLAYSLNKPIIPVNHLEGHIYANFVREVQSSKPASTRVKRGEFKVQSHIKFPILCLIVSGGHTSLVLMKEHLNYKIIGQTLDDAAGECLDKVGKLLGISYPAGPQIEILAKKGNPKTFDFPRPMINSNDFNFSFSGLKTAALKTVQDVGIVKNIQIEQVKRSNKLNKQGDRTIITDIAASFQKAVVDVLVSKTIKAAQKYRVKTIMLAGGVAANSLLRKELRSKVNFAVPPAKLCTDNAAMIAAAAYFRAKKFGLKKYKNWQKINADANLKLK